MEVKKELSGKVSLKYMFEKDEETLRRKKEGLEVHPGEPHKDDKDTNLGQPCSGYISKDQRRAKIICNSHKLASVGDYEEYCKIHLDPKVFSYFSAGSITTLTRDSNIEAFKKVLLSPKHLVDVSNPITRRTIHTTGETVVFPVGIAPTSFHKLATPEGEVATVKAAMKAGVVYVSSIDSNTKLEDIAQADPHAMRWQQTYLYKDRNLLMSILKRAKGAGVTAMVLTIDKPTTMMFGVDAATVSLLGGKTPNFIDNKRDRFSPEATWDDAHWFCEQSSLPVILKGVLTVEDVQMAIKVGAKGVIVSNHGGRALESLPPTMTCLRSVVEASKGQLEVFMDGGIRTGADVFKALAYGARMVFIGRAALWGLSHSGQDGLEEVLNILRRELVNTMMMAGVPSVDHISMDCIFQGQK